VHGGHVERPKSLQLSIGDPREVGATSGLSRTVSH
jgi:hypothetical protein